MDVLLEQLGAGWEGFVELWEAISALPADVGWTAFGIFVFVGLLKYANVVGEDEQAAAANVALSVFASYGHIGEENAALILAGTSVGAAAFYKVWDRWIVPLYNRLVEASKKTP